MGPFAIRWAKAATPGLPRWRKVVLHAVRSQPAARRTISQHLTEAASFWAVDV